MDILENKAHWQQQYNDNFLEHYHRTGSLDWKLYPHPRNTQAPPGPAIDASASRLMLISSAGAYLTGEQEPFDAADLLGDYSLRLIPSETPLEALAFAHDHYDHGAVDTDPQVLMPLCHLKELAGEGLIGETADSTVSFMGYQPDVGRVVDELIPPILKTAAAEKADAALLIPT
jgi:D-proline reductase (dithiol) PrdB